MLLEEMGRELVEVTSALVGGRTINIMNTDGVIVASSEHNRVGSYHQGAIEAVKTGKVVNIRADQLDRYPGAKEGCNMPLRVNGEIIGVVGIYGDPEKIQDIAHLLEVYATKYFQLETLLQPRLAQNTLRSRLLLSLLSPANTAMSASLTLAQNLNVSFRFPLYTAVISAPGGLGLPAQGEKLCGRLEELSFLQPGCDVWGVVDDRMVLVCSSCEGRQIHTLKTLSQLGYRVFLGTPGAALWQVHSAYHQALVLDASFPGDFGDIRDPSTRCHYLLANTALQEETFLDGLREKLITAFGPDYRIEMESIRTYYDCGRSVGTAAQKLFIHKNTLQYRVHKVLQALELTHLPPFRQEYLIRLLLEHIHRKSGPESPEI